MTPKIAAAILPERLGTFPVRCPGASEKQRPPPIIGLRPFAAPRAGPLGQYERTIRVPATGRRQAAQTTRPAARSVLVGVALLTATIVPELRIAADAPRAEVIHWWT